MPCPPNEAMIQIRRQPNRQPWWVVVRGEERTANPRALRRTHRVAQRCEKKSENLRGEDARQVVLEARQFGCGALDADRRYANSDEATCGDHTAASGRKAEEPSRQARNTLDEIFVQVQRVSEVIRSSNYSVDEAGARTGRVEA